MEVTKRLAAFAAGVSYNSIPAHVRDWSRIFLLDFVGVALGAAHFFKHNGDRLLERYLGAVAPRGPCTVLGYGVRTTPTLAAFSNGTLAEALDFQDSNMDVLTHNSTPIIPAALALGEALDARWSKVAAAIIAGYEVHSRLLATVQSGHWYRGFQGLGTFGTCGAAVAAGKLLGLDAQALKQALGVAGAIMPVSSSDNVFKPYPVGHLIVGPVELTLRLRNGEKITRRVDEVKWSPERPPSFEEIADKFQLCAEPLIGMARTDKAIAMVGGLEPNDRLAPLVTLVARLAATRAAPRKVQRRRT